MATKRGKSTDDDALIPIDSVILYLLRQVADDVRAIRNAVEEKRPTKKRRARSKRSSQIGSTR